MKAKKPLSGQKRAAPVDWDEVRRRGESVREALAQGFNLSAEEQRRILKARAQALAREPQKAEAGAEGIEVIEFSLAYEKYAIESAWVREVYPLRDLTFLPCTPPFVLGIVNVRGQILSVVDLRKFFDLPEKGLTDLNKVIILHKDGMEFGILADVVLGVERIPHGEIQPTLPTLTGIREEYLKGIAKGRTVILDAMRLLDDRNMIVHEEVE